MRRQRKQTAFQCGGCGEFLPAAGFCNDEHKALATKLKAEEDKHAKNVVLYFAAPTLKAHGWDINTASANFQEILRREHETTRAQRENRGVERVGAGGLRLRGFEAVWEADAAGRQTVAAQTRREARLGRTAEVFGAAPAPPETPEQVALRTQWMNWVMTGVGPEPPAPPDMPGTLPEPATMVAPPTDDWGWDDDGDGDGG